MDRPHQLPKSQRGHGATGEGQPRLSEPTQRNKTEAVKQIKMQKLNSVQLLRSHVTSDFLQLFRKSDGRSVGCISTAFAGGGGAGVGGSHRLQRSREPQMLHCLCVDCV